MSHAAAPNWQTIAHPAESGPAAEPGDVLAGYHLLHEVGRGGLARVFVARHVHPGREGELFAVKVMHPEWSASTRAVAAFRSEMQLTVAMRHPNVVRTFEAGCEEGRMYIAMELVDGVSLAALLGQVIEADASLPATVQLFIIGELLKGLAYAHELTDGDGQPLGVVHHDVTPGNLLLSASGEVKLTDFGVASLASNRRPGDAVVAGKIGYFAPEQLCHHDVDQRADVYVAGILAWELLHCRRLYAGDYAMEKNLRGRVPDVSALPPALGDVLRSALAPRPRRRFASVRSMLLALAPLLPPPAEGRAELAQVLAHLGIVATVEPVAAPRTRRAAPRVLVVAHDAHDLVSELVRWGLAPEIHDCEGSALTAASRRTYHALVTDAADLVDRFRALPGMGHQPAVCLAVGSAGWRTHRVEVGEPPRAVATALTSLLDRMSGERNFVRYPAELPATLTLGGRAHAVSTVDISRNGVAVRGEVVPAVGAEVGLASELDGAPWWARGVVRRVALEEDGGALVGVELTTMTDACEQTLVHAIHRADAG